MKFIVACILFSACATYSFAAMIASKTVVRSGRNRTLTLHDDRVSAREAHALCEMHGQKLADIWFGCKAIKKMAQRHNITTIWSNTLAVRKSDGSITLFDWNHLPSNIRPSHSLCVAIKYPKANLSQTSSEKPRNALNPVDFGEHDRKEPQLFDPREVSRRVGPGHMNYWFPAEGQESRVGRRHKYAKQALCNKRYAFVCVKENKYDGLEEPKFVGPVPLIIPTVRPTPTATQSPTPPNIYY